MKTTINIQLEAKECRALIAKALNIPVDNVVSTHYGFAIQGIPESTVAEKLKEASND